MLKTVDPTFKYYFCLHANETLNRLEQTPKLVIAALNGHTRRRRPRDRDGGRPPHRAQGRAARSGCPRSRSACCPAPAARSASRGSSTRATAIELMVDGRDVRLREGAWRSASSTRSGRRRRTTSSSTKIQEYAEQFCPPNKAVEGGRPHQALGAERRRDPVRVRARRRARAAAAAVPERGREGRPGRLRREAQGELQGEVVRFGRSCGPSPSRGRAVLVKP